VLSVPYFHTPDLSPVWSYDNYTGEKHHIAPFTFTNQDGEAFGSQNLEGKIYVANFFFTSCPSICPEMTNNLSTVEDAFAGDADVSLISFSVTPDIDSVPRLKDYHQGKEMGQNWNLLTGNQAKIYELSRRSCFVEDEIGFNKDSSDFLHTERCMLIDKNKHIRGVYNATVALDMQRLIDDIRALKEEE
jgi:protein SCO1/2